MAAVDRVLIVGAGISGLTLGIALRRTGIQVEILELRHEIRAQTGVGLSLQGNALAALARIGLASDCVAQGVAANHINIRSADGALLARQPVLRMGGETLPSTLGISRPVLHEILLRAGEYSGITLRTGVTVEHVASDDSGVDVRLTDGSERRVGLLVGADGIYSRTVLWCTRTSCRNPVGRRCGARPCRALRAAIPRSCTSAARSARWASVPSRMTQPTSTSWRALPATPAYEHEALAAVMLEKLRPYTGAMLRECVEHLAHAGSISVRPLEWLLAPAPWHRRRVVLVGDAAHSNPPVLAQGAAMGSRMQPCWPSCWAKRRSFRRCSSALSRAAIRAPA